MILLLELWLRGRIRRAGWRDVDPHDIVQHCYLRLLRAERIPPIDNRRAYLFRAAQNAMIQQQRSAAVIEINCVPSSELTRAVADHVPQDAAIEPATGCNGSHLRCTRCRTADARSMLRRFEGLSLRETAA